MRLKMLRMNFLLNFFTGLMLNLISESLVISIVQIRILLLFHYVIQKFFFRSFAFFLLRAILRALIIRFLRCFFIIRIFFMRGVLRLRVIGLYLWLIRFYLRELYPIIISILSWFLRALIIEISELIVTLNFLFVIWRLFLGVLLFCTRDTPCIGSPFGDRRFIPSFCLFKFVEIIILVLLTPSVTKSKANLLSLLIRFGTLMVAIVSPSTSKGSCCPITHFLGIRIIID